MADSVIESVADTAFWIAHYRALETERPDALFRDPLARVLAGEQGKKIAEMMPYAFWMNWSVVLRTCVIDDFLKRAIADGADVVLNLGAGLDARPYRMELPAALSWIEVDYPRMIEFKEQRLAGEKPRCKLERVPLDLADVPQRRQFFERVNGAAKKVIVLTEGVVPYLSVEEAGSLANDIHAMDRACGWIVDYVDPRMIRYRSRSRFQRNLRNAPFKFVPKDWFQFFAEHGWSCKEIRYLLDEGERLGRPLKLPPVMAAIFAVRSLFLSEEGKKKARRLAGYALLERAKPAAG